jgi:hypothetical protein
LFRFLAASEIRGAQLSTQREAFVPQQEHAHAIEALERSDSVERQGTSVLWTDKIAPAMREIFAWTADGRSQEEVAEAAFAASVVAA